MYVAPFNVAILIASTGENPASTKSSIPRWSPYPGTTPPSPVGSGPAISNPPAATNARSNSISRFTSMAPSCRAGRFAGRLRRIMYADVASGDIASSTACRSGGLPGMSLSKTGNVDVIATLCFTRVSIRSFASGALRIHLSSVGMPALLSKRRASSRDRAAC